VTRRPMSRQRLGKHIPTATNMHATIRLLLLLCNGAANTIECVTTGVFYVVRIYPLLGNECVFYGSASRLYK
jgi:hypothetical protein